MVSNSSAFAPLMKVLNEIYKRLIEPEITVKIRKQKKKEKVILSTQRKILLSNLLENFLRGERCFATYGRYGCGKSSFGFLVKDIFIQAYTGAIDLEYQEIVEKVKKENLSLFPCFISLTEVGNFTKFIQSLQEQIGVYFSEFKDRNLLEEYAIRKGARDENMDFFRTLCKDGMISIEDLDTFRSVLDNSVIPFLQERGSTGILLILDELERFTTMSALPKFGESILHLITGVLEYGQPENCFLLLVFTIEPGEVEQPHKRWTFVRERLTPKNLINEILIDKEEANKITRECLRLYMLDEIEENKAISNEKYVNKWREILKTADTMEKDNYLFPISLQLMNYIFDPLLGPGRNLPTFRTPFTILSRIYEYLYEHPILAQKLIEQNKCIDVDFILKESEWFLERLRDVEVFFATSDDLNKEIEKIMDLFHDDKQVRECFEFWFERMRLQGKFIAALPDDLPKHIRASRKMTKKVIKLITAKRESLPKYIIVH